MTSKMFVIAFFTLLFNLNSFLFAQNQKPNFVLIVVDDMRFDEWSGGGHSYLKTPGLDSLAKSGSKFTRAYHVVPLCSPNRASILTGQYPSRHGIIDNSARDRASFLLDLFPIELQKNGFKTGHVGKWHMGNNPNPRPGYDYWISFKGQGQVHNPLLFENGTPISTEGYITDILTHKSIDFIKQNKDNPFFLYIAHKGIHPEAVQFDDGSTDLSIPKKFIPAQRHNGIYSKSIFKRSPSYSKEAMADSGKPVIQEAFKLRTEVLKQDLAWESSMDLGVSEKSIQNRAEMMLSIDESIEEIRKTLKELKIEDKTTIIVTSDNGYFFGEHGFSLERRMPYEESVKSPLIIYSPTLEKQESVIDALTLSIDLSATILDLANIPITKTIQGKSLIPLLKGTKKNIRNSAFIEYFSNENPFPWTAQMDYRVLVTDQYKYINWLRSDHAELYDLKNDPFEQNNLIYEKGFDDLITYLHNKLKEEQVKALGL